MGTCAAWRAPATGVYCVYGVYGHLCCRCRCRVQGESCVPHTSRVFVFIILPVLPVLCPLV